MEPDLYTFVSVNRQNNEAAGPHCSGLDLLVQTYTGPIPLKCGNTDIFHSVARRPTSSIPEQIQRTLLSVCRRSSVVREKRAEILSSYCSVCSRRPCILQTNFRRVDSDYISDSETISPAAATAVSVKHRSGVRPFVCLSVPRAYSN